MKMCVLNDTSW